MGDFSAVISKLRRLIRASMSTAQCPGPDCSLPLHGFLNPNDAVAISFWIISISMVAASVFFLMESAAVDKHWKTSLNVGALVTIVAAVHYFYMREFYLILSAVNPSLSGMMFWRLLLGTVAMLAFGYAGEAQFVNPWAGFCAGMCGWFFILFEIFAGEAGSTASGTNKYVAASFSTMRLIVTVGWSIYPMGYFFGYLMGSVEDATLNLVYNLADFVNKIAFCLAIWNSAKKCTLEKAG